MLRGVRRFAGCAGFVLVTARCVPEFSFPDGGQGGNGGTPTHHCANQRLDYELGEENVDCGGECPACTGDCQPGTAECDGDTAELCETSILTDVLHCGSCRTPCELAGASEVSCSAGRCRIVACAAPYKDCNLISEDGCEANLSADPRNCGSCGAVCPESNGTALCVDGKCQLGACNPGFADCDGDGLCREDLRSDPLNCGQCGNACKAANGTGKCAESRCVIDTCVPGFDNCDSDSTDRGFATGCETQTSADPMNCGACASAGGANCVTALARGNAVGVCEAGSCKAGGCLSGFLDCDDDPLDCEIDAQNDALSCGACGSVCSTGQGTRENTCAGGKCQPVCETGYGDCDGNAQNGCETKLDTPTHCGACSNECGEEAPACLEGACQARIAVEKQAANGRSGGSLSFTHELSAGKNRLLLVAVIGRGLSGAPIAQATPERVTYGGQPMTLFGRFASPDEVGDVVPEGTDGLAYVFYYALGEAQLGALTPGQKTVAISGDTPAPNALVADAVLFSGVSQTTPLTLTTPVGQSSNVPGARTSTLQTPCQPSNAVTVPARGTVVYAIAAAQYSPAGIALSPLETTLDVPINSGGSQALMWAMGAHAGVKEELLPGQYTLGFSHTYCSVWMISTLFVNPHRVAPPED